MTDIEPDPKVRAAMNEINAAQRMREAAIQKAEADKVMVVKRAEASAEAKCALCITISLNTAHWSLLHRFGLMLIALSRMQHVLLSAGRENSCMFSAIQSSSVHEHLMSSVSLHVVITMRGAVGYVENRTVSVVYEGCPGWF